MSRWLKDPAAPPKTPEHKRDFRSEVSVLLGVSGPDDGSTELAQIEWTVRKLTDLRRAVTDIRWALLSLQHASADGLDPVIEMAEAALRSLEHG